MNTNEDNVVKQSGNDVKGCDLKRFVSTQYARISAIQCKYLEIFFFRNRISLDLNYSRLAGTSLTVITGMFQL